MMKIKQDFSDEHVEDLVSVLRSKLYIEEIKKLIKPGMSMAIAVGSRGIDQLVRITGLTVKMILI
jgi:hypothetical protein